MSDTGRRWIHNATGAEVSSLGGFPILYSDPPWAYSDRACNGAAEQHYRTMPLDQIKALPVGDLAAKDAVLFLWATFPLIDQALDLGRAWGFTYKSIGFCWVKRYGNSGDPFFGLGRWTRGNVEPCLLFTRGKPHRVSASVSQLIQTDDPSIVWPPHPAHHVLDAPIGRHSAKPAVVRERIVQLMGDLPAIELFAREPAPGWECWGNEVGSTVTLAPSTPTPTLAAPPTEPIDLMGYGRS